jgi:hypothetical protein
MISLPPVIDYDNIVYGTGFFPIKDKVKKLVLSIIKKECATEFDIAGWGRMQNYMAAMVFAQLVYSRTNSPYFTINEETIADYKKQIDYDEYKECFSCKGINIDEILDGFGYDDP